MGDIHSSLYLEHVLHTFLWVYYIRHIRINSLQIIQLNLVNNEAVNFKNILLHIDVRFELKAVGSFRLFNVELQICDVKSCIFWSSFSNIL